MVTLLHSLYADWLRHPAVIPPRLGDLRPAGWSRGRRRLWMTHMGFTLFTACLILWARSWRTVTYVCCPSFLWTLLTSTREEGYGAGGISCSRWSVRGDVTRQTSGMFFQLLRIITRHDLLPYVTLRKRQTGLQSCQFHFWEMIMYSESTVSTLCKIFGKVHM